MHGLRGCLFDKPSALERNLGRIAFEQGYATFEGRLPLSLRSERIQNGTMSIEEQRATCEKINLYRWLIQKAFCDLLRAIRNPEYKIAANLRSDRDALEVALKAKSCKVRLTPLKSNCENRFFDGKFMLRGVQTVPFTKQSVSSAHKVNRVSLLTRSPFLPCAVKWFDKPER
ncbi:MAG: hypothetical protein ACUVRR_10765 [Candidatus Fervidibacter sp.]|uniref:hypothetical protein n=1 Tax=Candidatus Fervidibacter sp. TaxID=3100871 RepID=UPI00404AE939